MTKSDFVFEKGEPIEVGSHGETDLLYHQGDPAPDTGRSDLVFEAGTGLGGLDAFHYGYGDIGDFSRWHSHVEEDLDIQIRAADHTDGSFRSEYAGEPTVIITARDDDAAGNAEQADIDKFGEVWDDTGQAMIMGEDNDQFGGRYRAQAVADYVNAALGTEGFDVSDSVAGGDNNCQNPSSSHPVFDGVSNMYRRRSELPLLADPSPISEISADISVFGGYDTGGQRMLIAGNVHTWDSSSGTYPECVDDRRFTVQALDWVMSA